jgi:hypothetical protein
MNGETMNTAALHPVDDFARAVRAALDDLPADEIDDLTDGLEADLAERASDQDSPDFGDPTEYALELRSAAGLPYRRPASSSARALDSSRRAARDLSLKIRSNPAASGVLAFFVSLRPIWWVYRGWSVFVWFQFGLGSGIHPLPATIVGALVFVPAMILSVQFGRGRWLPWAWMRIILILINVALAIATPWIVAWAFNASAWY